MGLATIMAAVRGLHLAATLSLLGTVGFIAWILPVASDVPDVLRRRLTRLWWISGSVAVLAGAGWFVVQASAIAGAGDLSDLLHALPVVAAHTRYGNVLMVRLALLIVATAVASTHRGVPLYLTLALAAVALGLQGLIGHAGATVGAIGYELVVSECLHLLAAGFWLGALLPLWLSLRSLAPQQAAMVCERFSPLGLACVLLLAGTGVAQGLELIGSVAALLGTRYGHIALLKITLFLIALGLAAINRLWLSDRLAAGASNARRHLQASVCVEACIGLAIVCAAAFMASSVPAAHATPVWPLSWQLSLITVDEDPELRREVVVSLVAIGTAVGLLIGAMLWRRLRLMALAVLLLCVMLRGPSLALLTVEAYPTSFQSSPTDFSAASIARGRTVFVQNCVTCHGRQAEGNGPAAAGLRIKPADLTMPHIWEHTDGQMYWWLTHGIDDPEGGMAMPGFGARLSAEDRWAVLDYIRAHNAGIAMQRDEAFDVPVQAPSLPITCDGVPAFSMKDLRGHAVQVVAGETAQYKIPPQAGISTINLALRGAAPAAGSCVAASPAAWDAYAVLADLPPEKLTGAAFLVDPAGWLRAVEAPGVADGWHTRNDLIAAVRGICTSPIHSSSGGAHEHHH